MVKKGFITIFIRESRRILTTKDLFLICLVAPLLYGGVLSSVYLHKRVEGVNVGVIDNDRTRLSRTFIRYADATENIHITGRYENTVDALCDIENDRITGILYIPSGFSSDIKKGQDAYHLVSINSKNFLLSNPVMQSLADVSATLSGGIMAAQLEKKGMNRTRALGLVQPVVLAPDVVYNPQLNYSDFFLPGILFVVVQQIILVGLGTSIAEEREEHRVGKLFELAGSDCLALMFGKTLPYVLLNFALGLFFLFAVLPWYGIVMHGPVFGIILFMGLFVTATAAFGIFLSIFFKSVTMALIILMFYSMPTFLFSGFSWPVYAMPLPIRIINFFFPSTYFLSSFRLMLLGGAGLSDVLGSVIYLLIVTIIGFVVTYAFLMYFLRQKGFLQDN